MKPLAIVTGASSGIGEATARALSREGHPLLLLARRLDRLDALALPNTINRPVDVRKTADVADAIREAEATYGPADLLVNNAGVMNLSDIATQDPVQWQSMFDINVVALLEVAQLVLPGMKARRSGTIINIGSIAGRNIYGNHTAYCGTKFAVHAMTEGLRREVASDHVRVIVIAPGLVDTELLDHTASETIKADYRKYRDGVGGGIPSSDVADAIVWAYGVPKRTCIREVVMAPTAQDS